ncbi:MAG: hypothetical protein IJ751_07355 [Oscillospiraceae bacterium]|nr:hypothetical protein [Oscillospiraceae bacterium]
MNCPFCGAEMEQGKASFMAMQGLGHMILSFVSEEESHKRFFQRKSRDKIILSWEEAACYFCPSCKRLIPVFELDD